MAANQRFSALRDQMLASDEWKPLTWRDAFDLISAHVDVVRYGYDRWMMNVANDLSKTGNIESSIALMEICIIAIERDAPAEKQIGAVARRKLAWYLVQEGRFFEAERNFLDSASRAD